MKKSASFLLLITYYSLLTSCGSSDKKGDTPKKDKYEQTKETLEQTEKKNPERFISVTSRDKHNIIGQTVIKGTLTNNAKVASYKDVELKLSFYSKTKALLEEDSETIYETIAPGKDTDFKTKYYAPKGTDSIAIKVVGAKSE